MPGRVFTFAALITSLCSIGCASSGSDGGAWRTSLASESAFQKAKAHPSAYGIIDGFPIDQPHRIRPENEFHFYFKDCESISPSSEQAFFSKTAYSCQDF